MFSLAIEHTYFHKGRLTGTQFTASSRTQRLIDNTNLCIRSREDGVTAFFEPDSVDALNLYARDGDDPLALVFECRTLHTQFQNFTDESVYADGMVLAFDSSTLDDASSGTKYLHREEYASAKDLVSQSSGAARVRQPIFRVGVSITPEELERLNTTPSAPANEYRIKFKARETYWKYFVMSDVDSGEPEIQDLDGAVEFTKIPDEVLAEDRTAKVFVSKQPIALQEYSNHRFQLQTRRNERTRVLVNRLPVASVNRINRADVAGQLLPVSEIYVNY